MLALTVADDLRVIFEGVGDTREERAISGAAPVWRGSLTAAQP